jgi:hypothetical protein
MKLDRFDLVSLTRGNIMGQCDWSVVLGGKRVVSMHNKTAQDLGWPLHLFGRLFDRTNSGLLLPPFSSLSLMGISYQGRH